MQKEWFFAKNPVESSPLGPLDATVEIRKSTLDSHHGIGTP